MVSGLVIAAFTYLEFFFFLAVAFTFGLPGLAFGLH